jgi:AcrR family transcriptional regulator
MEDRAKLLETSFALFMRYGLRSVTMDDISKTIGWSKKTIYKYVSNKDELIEQIFFQFLEKEREQVELINHNYDNALDQMNALSEWILTFIRGMRPVILFDLRKYYPKLWNYLQTSHMSHIEKSVIDNINAGIKQGVYRKDINPVMITKLYISMIKTINDPDIFNGEEYELSDLYKELFSYHLAGISIKRFN